MVSQRLDMGDVRLDLVREIFDNSFLLVEPCEEVGRVLRWILGYVSFNGPNEDTNALAGVGQAAQCICCLFVVLIDAMKPMNRSDHEISNRDGARTYSQYLSHDGYRTAQS